MTNIVLIGAGSVEFTQILLSDLVEFPELVDSTITLHDIDAERLDTAERMAHLINSSAETDLRIRGTLDRRAALDGADFVVNEIQVGGLEATLRDFAIPKAHGLRQTIADTIGVGGIFRGLRTIPVLVAIAREMTELCPDAMLLNYANPMAMLPWAVWEATGLKRAIGLCHSVQNTHEAAGRPRRRARRGDRLPHRRPQPPGLCAGL
jgi:alpha-galactosidase